MQIIQFLHDKMGSPVVLDPKLCLLGLLPDVEIDKYQATFLNETLFMARRGIAKVWMQAQPPSIRQWKRYVNDALPFKKFVP